MGGDSDFEEIFLGDLKPYYRVPGAIHSEGISFVKETGTLLWVDIFKGQVHKVEDIEHPESSHSSFSITRANYGKNSSVGYPPNPDNLKESMGCIFPIFNGASQHEIKQVLFGSKFGIGRLDFTTGEWEYVILYSNCPDLSTDRAYKLRSNDGNVSPDGKYIYVGLMSDFPFELEPIGCLLRVDLLAQEVELVWNCLLIPNAIHWDESDQKTVYVTDSLNFTIWKCPGGDLLKREELIDVKNSNNQSFESPEPDGSAIWFSKGTHSGYLFIAVWSTCKVQMFDLAHGKLLKEFILPKSTPRVSCCCFVGKDLFVTTANAEINDAIRRNTDKNGGCIYRIPNALDGDVPLESTKRQPLY
ncbi:YBR053C [Saccharomyces arboricola H-6]|uniref:YBR053C n=1 Tax=Saccharomyces arboricola (strain H-6 / AS 2.3317 / CBS 10644) TaxID=1160507 RepID=J8Q886_SACAR|nr:YBR053C [Saccharomyces arboricola H-6]